MSKKSQKISYHVPVEGSLGLLALGAKGIKAWRKKKEEMRESKGGIDGE